MILVVILEILIHLFISTPLTKHLHREWALKTNVKCLPLKALRALYAFVIYGTLLRICQLWKKWLALDDGPIDLELEPVKAQSLDFSQHIL